MKRVAWIVLAVAMMGTALAEDAPKHPWASFKVGSWAKSKTTTKMMIAGNANESVMETTQTLLSLTDTEAEVEYETVVAGNSTKTTIKMPLKSEKPEEKAADAPKPETGEEEITVAGKKMKTRWMKMVTEANGMKTTSKSWTSEEVPGFMVKMESHTEGAFTSDSTTELVGFEAK